LASAKAFAQTGNNSDKESEKFMKSLRHFFQSSHIQIFIVILPLSLFTLMQQQAVAQQSVIKLSARVNDKDKHPVKGLNSNDFVLFEGDTPQTISSFSNEELPVSYGLMIDCTGSMRDHFKDVIETAKTIVNQNKPNDETFIVILIDGMIKIIANWTSDKKLLLTAFDTIQEAKGMCSITDSLYACNAFFTSRPNRPEDKYYRQKALILLSDGLEKQGKYTANQLITFLRETDIQVYAISFYQPVPRTSLLKIDGHEKVKAYLGKISEETGGNAFFPQSDKAPINLEQIFASIRNQYILGYIPAQNKDKKSPKVRVKLNETLSKNKYSITTRLLPASSQTK
jgi:Ca-activated chloride channel family protein